MSASIETVIKMLESLPRSEQDRVVEHLSEYLQDLEDERHWDNQFEATQPELVAAALRARQEIAEGKSKPLDPDQL
jgi:hypothetical protein